MLTNVFYDKINHLLAVTLQNYFLSLKYSYLKGESGGKKKVHIVFIVNESLDNHETTFSEANANNILQT